MYKFILIDTALILTKQWSLDLMVLHYQNLWDSKNQPLTYSVVFLECWHEQNTHLSWCRLVHSDQTTDSPCSDVQVHCNVTLNVYPYQSIYPLNQHYFQLEVEVNTV